MGEIIIKKIEDKFKAISFPKLILVAFILGGVGSLIIVITRDILNLFI